MGLRQSLARQAARSRKKFLDALEGGRNTQDAFLVEVLQKNRETSFGVEHGFQKLGNVDDFRSALPIRHYPDLAPWIERSASGESAVLTQEEPIRFWKTTGTTSEPKKIPVTPSSSAKTMESFLALQGTQLHYYPELNERRDTTLVTHVSPKTVKEFLGPRQVPYCSTTEVPVVIRAGREEFVAPWVPGLQQVVEDDAVRLYYLLCYAAAHDLKCVACLHPSRFQTVVSTLLTSGERLVQELRDGTVLGERCREPLPERADSLQEILRSNGRLRPRDLWPNLSFVTSWSGSYISRYRPTIEENFCTSFLPMPSISSEAFTTLTIDEDPIGQPINLPANLFEFLPSEQKVEPGSETRLFHELQSGATYELVLTTLGGLYRYATCDIFRVVGYVGEVPRLEYVGRRSVSDLTGEKLAEEHIADSVPEALKRHDLEDSPFTVCGLQATSAEGRPKYVLVVENHEDSPKGLASDLDQRLKAINSRYELKRNFGDLHPLEVVRVLPGTFAGYRREQAEAGLPAGQLKDRILHSNGEEALASLLRLSGAGI